MSHSAEFTTERRKEDHIRINLEENVQSRLTTGLEKYLCLFIIMSCRNISGLRNRALFCLVHQISYALNLKACFLEKNRVYFMLPKC